MPCKYKLSKRLALMRDAIVGLAVLAFACTGDRTISGPTKPSFSTSSSQPA